jgi:hypothetical protein
MNLDNFGPAVYDDEPIRISCRQSEVAFADIVVECGALIINARFRLADALIPPLSAPEAGVQIDIDEHRHIGLQTLAGDAIEFEDSVRMQAAAAALINKRGVRKAVAQHNGARFESGADHLFHILRAAGEVEQQFGARVNLGVYRIEQNAANLLTDIGAAGLYRFDNGPAAAAKRSGKQAKLRGLATPVNAFKGDKTTAWFQNYNFRKCFSAASARFSPVPGRKAP